MTASPMFFRDISTHTTLALPHFCNLGFVSTHDFQQLESTHMLRSPSAGSDAAKSIMDDDDTNFLVDAADDWHRPRNRVLVPNIGKFDIHWPGKIDLGARYDA